MEPFTFASSTDLRIPLAVKITRLEGHERPLPYSTLLRRPDLRHRGSNLSPHSDLYITVQPFSASKPLTVPAQTPYKSFGKTGARVWNTWLHLPVEFCTFPRDTVLAITLWDVTGVPAASGDWAGQHHIPFGGTTIPLFDEEGTLRTGRQKCRLHRHKSADGFSETTTPWADPKPRKRGRRKAWEDESDGLVVDEKASRREKELERLVGLMKRHEMGEIAESKWLDQMVFRQIERLERQSVRDSNRPRAATLPSPPQSPPADREGEHSQQPVCADRDPDHVDGAFFLYLELPRFDHPIVFTDFEYPPPPVSAISAPAAQNAAAGAGVVNFKPPPEVQLGPGIHSSADGGYAGDTSDGGGASTLFQVYDPEIGYNDNPAETKHRRLIRGQRNALDRDLKPNPKMRDFLHSIMLKGPTADLTDKEKDEVWRFRHHLTRDKRALTKLVKSVNWNDRVESKQAIALLPKWAEIDVDDALELLGPGVRERQVRAFAVERLRKAGDEELGLYLLQLVQALKFEPRKKKDGEGERGAGHKQKRGRTHDDQEMVAEENETREAETEAEGEQHGSLAAFLIARSAANLKLATFLHWYLMVELDTSAPPPPPGTPAARALEKNRELYARVSYDFMLALASTSEGQDRRRILLRQGELITILAKISKDVRNVRGDRLKKIEALKKMLADPKNELLSFPGGPLALPLDPDVKAIGVSAEECNVFKSTLSPFYLTFRTAPTAAVPEQVDGGAGEERQKSKTSKKRPETRSTDEGKYPLIFKTGDDLRQDQLVIQIIALMDRLLLNENLDLRLTPYRILATSTLAGAVQFIPSTPLSTILSSPAKYGPSNTAILNYLRQHNPPTSTPSSSTQASASILGVRKDAMENYVRSLAGYCIITYLLGVGDRHLDNLLLTPEGRFFHIDFGYILGRDPKPLAPLMKITVEMVEGMGGVPPATTANPTGGATGGGAAQNSGSAGSGTGIGGGGGGAGLKGTSAGGNGGVSGTAPGDAPPPSSSSATVPPNSASTASPNPSFPSHESQFDLFKQYSITAYTTLRRSAPLILNLFALMSDAAIPGLSSFSPGEKTAVQRVEERFRLDVSEEEAVMFLRGTIESQMGRWSGVVIDKLHGLAQGWRA
ncbi:putative phosphoinositide 3-kinase [Hortaea werneckii]|nr:putative phosphoinositide 3-kinase [Hortaea werneckii]KAI7349686.1 putative phosphoinositide 3-kinase [Hortaea werneckii]